MHKTLWVMHATETEAVVLASYRLKEVAYYWFELWEESREEGSPPARWSEFADAFIDNFFPAETKAAGAVEFESLRQGSLSVWEYHIRKMVAFTQATENRKLKNKIEQEGSSKARFAGHFGGGGGSSAFRGGSSGPSQYFA
ncbi:uncharacterized protein [Nicotiana tomentosiformis]|uniref:uncharacterized protein n=1 Tax=Nicotiana tomentosiformis TaxID=4098 RepID=UPI00388C3E36